MKLFRRIHKIFNGVSGAYAGAYRSVPQELGEFEIHLKNLDIPTLKQDRQNLTGDFKMVGNDFKTSFQKYKNNGKTSNKTANRTRNAGAFD